MSSILLIPAPFVDAGKVVSYVPYGLLSLQAVAAERGHRVSVLSFSQISGARFASSDELANAVAGLVDEESRSVVGLSTMCSSFHHSLGIAVELRRRSPRLKIWLGGPHSSAMPGLVLERFPEIDAVFVGEGEATFAELLGSPESEWDGLLDALPGVWTRQAPFVARAPIADLDTLPFIDQAADYSACVEMSDDDSSEGIPVEVERGCPGRCTFCSTRLFWSGGVRHKSAARLITEMHRLHAMTAKSVFSFIGDNLAASRPRLLTLCRQLRAEAPDYAWECSLKIDRLEPEDLDVLWDGGCRRIFVGLESGCQETLDRMRKDIDLRRSLELLYRAVDKGFYVHTSFIAGFPWETAPQLEQTYLLHDRLLKRGAHSVMTALCPLPGTELERTRAVQPRKGFSGAGIDWLARGPVAASIVDRCPELFTQLGAFETPDLEPAELKATVLAASMLTAYYEQRMNEEARTT